MELCIVLLDNNCCDSMIKSSVNYRTNAFHSIQWSTRDLLCFRSACFLFFVFAHAVSTRRCSLFLWHCRTQCAGYVQSSSMVGYIYFSPARLSPWWPNYSICLSFPRHGGLPLVSDIMMINSLEFTFDVVHVPFRRICSFFFLIVYIISFAMMLLYFVVWFGWHLFVSQGIW